MIYHILNGSFDHLTPGIIKIISYYANYTSKNGISDHYFYIITYSKQMLYKNNKESYLAEFKKCNIQAYEEIDSTKKLFIKLKKIEDNDNIIIFHGSNLGTNKYLLYIMLIIFKKLEKCILICWGEDDFILNSKYYIKKTVIKIFLQHVFDRMRNVVLISKGDKKAFSEIYSKTKCVYSPYLEINEEFRKVKKKSNYINIMVSHSGWSHNDHNKAFKLLEKYKDEKIRIICPLCYGDKIYIENVIRIGKEIFNNNFIYFTDLKSKEEYTKMLLGVDIYISCAQIQTGLYALNTILHNGGKVYIDGNLLYSMQQFNFIVKDINKIKLEKFSSFSKSLSKNERLHNKKIFDYEYANINNRIKMWESIYFY